VGPRLRALFTSAGMDADKDVQLSPLPARSGEAFADGRIDVLFAHTPYLETFLCSTTRPACRHVGGEVPILADGRSMLWERLARWREQAEMMARSRAPSIVRSGSSTLTPRALSMRSLPPAPPAGSAHGRSIRCGLWPAVRVTPNFTEGVERDATLYPAHPRAPDSRG